jgi:hypothetical protein
VLLEYQNKLWKLLTNAALPAFLRAVLAVLTVLAGMAGVSSCTGRCGGTRWNLADEKNRQQHLSQNNEESWFKHVCTLLENIGDDRRA